MINFNASTEEFDLITKITERAIALSPFPLNTLELMMDITACHLNGMPLQLEELLQADESDFVHDLGGIRKHIDRTTGKMTGCFMPRYAKLEGA